MIIDNIMSTKFSVLKISDSEHTARQLMVETGASYLPVIGDAGEVFGIIWQADLFQKLQPIVNKKSNKDTNSKEESSPVRDAAILLQKNDSDCLFVVVDNRLIGRFDSQLSWRYDRATGGSGRVEI